MVQMMTTDRKALLELIRKQPPMSSERFWQQVEKAKALSPNVERLPVGPKNTTDRSVTAST